MLQRAFHHLGLLIGDVNGRLDLKDWSSFRYGDESAEHVEDTVGVDFKTERLLCDLG